MTTESSAKQIIDVHTTGRPILVGTASVAESERLAAALEDAGDPCRVLNAKNDEAEALVNETFTERYLAGEEALGTALVWGRAESPVRIVGVVEDTRHVSLEAEPRPASLEKRPFSGWWTTSRPKLRPNSSSNCFCFFDSLVGVKTWNMTSWSPRPRTTSAFTPPRPTVPTAQSS